MDNEDIIIELKAKNTELEGRMSILEFKVQLLFEDTNTSRMLFEYNVTHSQYKLLMDLMDEYREAIDNGSKVNHGTFEQRVYKIIEKTGDYHFCEAFAQSLMEDEKWEEVFPALYGHMNKYKYYLALKNKGEV